jgi:hypothetical protein
MTRPHTAPAFVAPERHFCSGAPSDRKINGNGHSKKPNRGFYYSCRFVFAVVLSVKNLFLDN